MLVRILPEERRNARVLYLSYAHDSCLAIQPITSKSGDFLPLKPPYLRASAVGAVVDYSSPRTNLLSALSIFCFTINVNQLSQGEVMMLKIAKSG